MPIIKDAEIWWAKLDPEHPTSKYLKKNTKEWSIEIRTYDRDTADMWEEEYRIKPKKMKTDDGRTYFKVNLQKMAVLDINDPTSKMAGPVEVVGPRLQSLDPRIVGNGSIGDILVKHREWTFEGKKGVTADLVKVRIKKLVEFHREFEDFEKLDEELEVIGTSSKGDASQGEEDFEDNEIYD